MKHGGISMPLMVVLWVTSRLGCHQAVFQRWVSVWTLRVHVSIFFVASLDGYILLYMSFSMVIASDGSSWQLKCFVFQILFNYCESDVVCIITRFLDPGTGSLHEPNLVLVATQSKKA